MEPLVPVTVIVYVPEGVEPIVLSVRPAIASGVTVDGLIRQVGRSDVTVEDVTVQVRETALLNPPEP